MKKREEDKPTPSGWEVLFVELKKFSAIDGLKKRKNVLACLAVFWLLMLLHFENDVLNGALAIHKLDNMRCRLVERENSTTFEETDVSLKIFSDPKPAINARLRDCRGEWFIFLAVASSVFPAFDSASDIEIQKTGNPTRECENIFLFRFWDELVRRVVRGAEPRRWTTTSAEVWTKSALTRQVCQRTHGLKALGPDLRERRFENIPIWPAKNRTGFHLAFIGYLAEAGSLPAAGNEFPIIVGKNAKRESVTHVSMNAEIPMDIPHDAEQALVVFER